MEGILSGVFPVARLGTMALVWTIGFCAVGLYFVWQTLNAISNGNAPDTYDLSVAVLLSAFMVYNWLRSVKRYTIADGNLYIERQVLGQITVPLESMRLVEALSSPVSFFNVNMVSTGGLFGWSGKTQLRKAGDRLALEAEVYGTNPGKVVIIGLEDERTYVVTPADPDGMVDALRAGMRPVKAEEGYLPRTSRRVKKGKKG